MTSAIAAVLVILSVFGGIGFVVAVIAGSILVANGKLTFPGTTMRKVQQQRAALAIAQMNVEMERARNEYELLIDDRLARGSLPAGSEAEHD